jgi:uncharacterized protein YoxC
MLEISFFILSLAFLLLVLFFAPLFRQMWRTAKNMAEALESLNQSLPGIQKNLEEITKNINSAANTLNTEMEILAHLGRKVRGILEFSEDVEQILQRGVKQPLLGTITIVRSLVKGVRVFFDVLQSKQGRPAGGSK